MACDGVLEVMLDLIFFFKAMRLEEAVPLSEEDVMKAGEVRPEAFSESLARKLGEVTKGL